MHVYSSEVAMDLVCRSRLRQGSAFLSDQEPGPESKFCEKPEPDLESLLNFGSSRCLRGYS